MHRIQLSLSGGILFVLATAAVAMDVKGTVTAVDAAKRTISVKADDNVQAFDVAKDAKVYELYGSGKRTGYNETAHGLADVTVDATVTVSTDFIDGREQATRIKIESAPAKAPRKKTSSASPPAEKSSTTDVNGTITALDSRRLLMIVDVDGKSQKFTAAKDCKVFMQVGKPDKKKPRYDVSPKGLADITVGLDVTMTVDSSSGKDLVTMVKIHSPAKK